MNKFSFKKILFKIGPRQATQRRSLKEGFAGVLGLPSAFFIILLLRTHHTWSLGEGLLPRVSP
jgi:hypothetical protein